MTDVAEIIILVEAENGLSVDEIIRKLTPAWPHDRPPLTVAYVQDVVRRLLPRFSVVH